MAIYKQDGSQYFPLGSMNQWDVGSQTNKLFDAYAAEAIALGGSPVIYYQVFIGQDSIDPLYVESRGKFWSNVGIELRASYNPTSSSATMSMFGIDSLDYMTFYFSYKAVLEKLNHPINIGDLLYSPHLRQFWECRQHKTAGYERWGLSILQIECVLFQEDVVTSAGSVKRTSPDFNVFGEPTT